MPGNDATPAPAAPRSAGALPARLGTAGGVFLGAVFLFAALSKAIDPAAFEELIEVEGLDFLLPAWLVAPLAIALEGGLGAALILGVRRLFVLLPAAALAAFFLFLTARAWIASWHGGGDAVASCGCFGNLLDRTPAEAFWQDLLMLAPALLLAFLGRPRAAPWPRRRAVGALSMAGGLVLLAILAPDLPLDALATRVKSGDRAADLCSGRGAERVCVQTLLPELEVGDHLVLIADLDDASLVKQLPALNDFAQQATGTQLWLLCDATEEAKEAWYWTHAPSFEVRVAPRALLRPLYRRLPRSFRVRDGLVVEAYDGIPTAEELVSAP